MDVSSYVTVPTGEPLFDSHRFGNDHLRAVWRLSLGLGVFPALAVLIWRLNMQNPTSYKKNSMRDTRIPYWLVIKRYWVNLLAISLTWFIYDFITCVSVISSAGLRRTNLAISRYPVRLLTGLLTLMSADLSFAQFGIYSSTVVDTYVSVSLDIAHDVIVSQHYWRQLFAERCFRLGYRYQVGQGKLYHTSVTEIFTVCSTCPEPLAERSWSIILAQSTPWCASVLL